MASGLLKDYVGRGLLAARPATPTPAAGVGSYYFATDVELLYSWDGTVWRTVSIAQGGTVGQVLTKNSSTDGDVKWAAGGGGGSSNPWWFSPDVAANFSTIVYNAAGSTPSPTIVDDTNIGTVATFQNLTGGGTMAGIFKARTFTGDWQLDARLSTLTNPGNYAGAGLCIRDSATGRCTTFGSFSDASGQTPTAIASTQWTFDTTSSSYNSHNFKEYGHISGVNDLFLRLKFTLSTGLIEFLISADGKNFRSMFGSGVTYNSWTATPNQIGFYHQNQFSSTPDNNQVVTCGRWVMVG